jgi:hypothetical protein
MVEIKITPEMIDRAKTRDLEAGPAYKNASIQNGKGRFYGFLGEEIVHQSLPGSILAPTKDYDLIYRNFTFDVKTKTRKDPPKPWYDATVDQSATHQNPYFYIFVQILAPQSLIKLSTNEIRNFPYQTGWIIGLIPRTMFYEKARFFQAGDVDPSNGIKYRDSIHLVRCNQLIDAKKLLATATQKLAG